MAGPGVVRSGAAVIPVSQGKTKRTFYENRETLTAQLRPQPPAAQHGQQPGPQPAADGLSK